MKRENLELGFDNLLGIRTLTGVDFDKRFDGEHNDAEQMNLELDGWIVTVLSDEDDGYRSYLGNVIISAGKSNNPFPAHQVEVSKLEDGHFVGYQIVDVITNKEIVRFGTNHTDVWYPFFVAGFDPTALAVNNNPKG